MGSVFDKNSSAFVLENRGGQPTPEIHTSVFLNNTVDVVTSNDGADVNAQGNFVGAKGDFTTEGGVLRALPAGLAANLPRVVDVFDNPANEHHVHLDNPLDDRVTDPSATPITFLRSPVQAEHVAADGCVRVEVESPYGPLADLASCDLFLLGASGDPNGVDRTPVTLDGDGCLATTPPPGEHAVLAECTVNDTSVIEQSVGRFLVDDVKRSGRTRPGVETWSGVVELDGDVTVPFGSTLVIAPGTVVRMATSDRLRGERVPNNFDQPGGEGGVVDDDGPNCPNRGFGDRGLVDLLVDGNLVAQGTAQQPIRFESVTGASVPQQWGGIRVAKLGTASLDFVQIDGASVAVHGELVPADPLQAPQIDITNTTITSSAHGVRGVCPATFSDNAMRDVFFAFSEAHCSDALTILRSDFDRIGDPQATNTVAFALGTYASGGPTSVVFTFDQSTLRRGFGIPGSVAFAPKSGHNIGLALIRDSSVDGYNTVVGFASKGTALTYSVILRRSVVTNFKAIHQATSFSLAQLQLDQCRLITGDAIMTSQSNALDVNIADTLVRNVTIPINDVDLDATPSISIVRSQFENAATVFLWDM
jgi:hypothetical protein